MKYYQHGREAKEISALALGCMRMADKSVQEAGLVIEAALEAGINFFDHADIYGGGQSEIRFSQAVKELGIKRDAMIIQSKLGIRKGYYDFSKDHILASVDGILERLDTDHLDYLLLHRPDTLMEPEEVAEAFNQLQASGKVLNFGVSNHNIYQIELLQSAVKQPLKVNQLQFGPAHTLMIDEGINVNTYYPAGIQRSGDILNYCRLKDILIQAWSPFQVDLEQGLFIKHPDYQELKSTLEAMANDYHLSLEALVLAWIYRHPATIQTIIGSMNPDRIQAMAAFDQIDLSREDWYRIYRSAGKQII